MKNKEIGLAFITVGVLALILGLLFGTIGALQFVFPDFLNTLPFFKSRPLHVSLVVSWIFLCSIGGIYYYLPRYCKLPLFSKMLTKIHFWLFLLTGASIVVSYLLGKFGGREYWAFPPFFAIPIIVSWIIFGINYFKTVFSNKHTWPVYMWMWGTGILFFLYTFIEANLWAFSYFNGNIVREITIQWKAYGSLVGSWNMLVYGTAIFVMEKVSGDRKFAFSKIAFLLYFLGLTNLMFGWAHHTYAVPSAAWIRTLAYAVSMTELLILGRIIWLWKDTLSSAQKHYYSLPYRFLIASEIWVFLNLILAIVISIPAINLFTHGTHITVAHAMGSTIGINTMILLSSVFFIAEKLMNTLSTKIIRIGYYVTNFSLLIFWVSLILAGIGKGVIAFNQGMDFNQMMEYIKPYLYGFSISGVGLLMGLLLILFPALPALTKAYWHGIPKKPTLNDRTRSIPTMEEEVAEQLIN